MDLSPAKRRRIHLIAWPAMAVVLVASFLGILKLGVVYSSDILYELVKRETNGRYLLTFEQIDVNPWKRSIKLKKVHLKPDPNKEPNEEGLNNLYDLELAGLNIDLKSILSIYTRRQLVMENVRIIDPQIHITKKKQAPDESFSLQTGNLYKEISGYLRVLQIDLLAIDQAKFKHSPSEFGLGNIDILMRNLLIDSASRPDQRFYSENIELEINDQSFTLSDSIHQLHFDRFLLSTADSVLTFENVVLTTHGDAVDSIDKLNKTAYDIAIPQLKLQGVDYFSAYRYNRLEMKALSITDAHLLIAEQKKEKIDQQQEKGNSLFRELLSIFDQVRIGKMRFINTNLNLKTNNDYNNNYQHVKSERADIVLYNFQLDSSNYQFDLGKKYFDNIDLIIHNYSSYFPDSIHTIDFELLRLSSFDSSLVFRNFKISNNGNGSHSDMFLSIDLPLIRLNGLNYLDILIKKQLIIREMRLQNPKIVFNGQPGDTEKVNFSPDSLYGLVSDQFQVVGIKKLLLNQGVFSINKQLTLAKGDLSISDLYIPSDTNSWHDALGDLSVEMHDVFLHNKDLDLNVGHLKWDSLAAHLVIDELQLNFLNENIAAEGDLSNLSISGLNLDSISDGNYLAFDSISFINPHVNIKILKPILENTSGAISREKFIEVVNGQLNIQNHDSSALSLKRIFTELTWGENNQIQNGQADSISITLPKSHNSLNIKQLNLTRSQDLYVEDITLQRMKNAPQDKVELKGVIPKLTLFGVNQDLFWLDHKIAADSLMVTTPDLQLTLNQSIAGTIPTDSSEVQIEKIILDRGRLTFTERDGANNKIINTPLVSATIESFHYPHKALVSPDHLIYADELTINLKELESTLKNGDTFRARQLDFDKTNASILIDDFRYDSPDGATSARLPHLKLVGLDLYEYVNQKHLKLDTIQLIEPNISHDQSLIKATQSDAKTNLPESLDIGWFSSLATEFTFNSRLNAVYAVHNGKVEIHNYSTSDGIAWTQLFNDAQYAIISGEDFEMPVGDGYQINIDSYDLNHPKNTLILDNVSLTSKYTPTEYSRRLATQKDWFDVHASDITFSGLDLERSLSKKEFYARKVFVEELNALFYRDKNVPFDSTAVKPLPQTMLLDLDTWVFIDTLQVRGDITHRLRPENNDEIAELSFNDIDASLMQITTVKSLANNPMRLVSTGRLADAAPFQISVSFDMNHPKDRFSFAGQIDDMQLDVLNKLLRPLANINIRDGYAERINFTIKADNEVATGEMRFRYENLKIQILNPETNDTQGLNQGIKTFFANTFVINDKNPSFIVLKPSTIFHERDDSRVIFHYWGESLLSGAVSSIGINKSKKAEKRYEKAK